MKNVPRHAVEVENARQQVSMNGLVLASGVTHARSKPDLLGQLLRVSVTHAASAEVPNDDPTVACSSLKIAAQAARALFLAATAESAFEITLGEGPPSTLQPTGPTDASHVGNWLMGFHVAAICRDQVTLDTLCSLPIDALRSSFSKADECLYLFAEALQAFWREQEGVGRRIQAALEATEPSRIGVSGADFVLNLLVPEIELMFRFVLNDAAAFDDALAFALERHKKYWSKGGRKLDPLGWLALGPLAFASLAHDAGVSFTVVSEYIPPRFYRGDCA